MYLFWLTSQTLIRSKRSVIWLFKISKFERKFKIRTKKIPHGHRVTSVRVVYKNRWRAFQISCNWISTPWNGLLCPSLRIRDLTLWCWVYLLVSEPLLVYWLFKLSLLLEMLRCRPNMRLYNSINKHSNDHGVAIVYYLW